MMKSVRHVLSNYATFSGRAARPEYWWWVLAIVLALLAAGLVDEAIFGAMLDEPDVDGSPVRVFSPILSLAVLLPTLAVAARRLHDTDRSAWWLLLSLVPVIGTLVLIWFYVQPGTDGPNRFGPPAPPL